MRFDGEKRELVLAEDEAKIVLAYLFETVLGEELTQQFTVQSVALMMHRVERGGASEEAIRESTPELFEYRVPAKERPALLRAFTLAVEGLEPSTRQPLADMDTQQIIDIAGAGRQALLEM